MVMRPGVNVEVRSASAPSGPSVDTGTSFVVGLSERGSTTAPILVRNMTDFETFFGTRQSWSELWDSMDEFFHDGGLRAFIQRVVGPAASVGTHSFDDRAGSPVATIAVDAITSGAWSSDITVQVADGEADDTFELFVFHQGLLKERSGDLADPTAAVLWSADSVWVRVRDLDSATAGPNNNPAVIAATALSAGSDDRDSITDTHKTAALARMGKELGPGQVWVPGATTDAIHTALIDHAIEANRTAILDAADDGVVSTLVASALAVRNNNLEPERAGLFGPRIVIPGLTPTTKRTVPASAMVSALMARNDAVNGPSVPAAGPRGQSVYALDVSFEFTDAERQTLNEAGVNVIRPLFGPITIYGYRTCSLVTNWRSLSDQRLRMQIANDADLLGEEFMFSQMDGQGRDIAEYGGALTGMLAQYYNRGALYGATPDQAFSVNVGPSVNTPDTIANGELRSVLGVRMSPFAEMVLIELVKSPINQAL